MIYEYNYTAAIIAGLRQEKNKKQHIKEKGGN
jgi:hypothetical protein